MTRQRRAEFAGLGENAERDMSSSETDRPPADQDQDQKVEWLQRIHDQLERANRRDRQSDFSVLRLSGALMQMFAVVAAIWGVVGLVDGQATSATARLTLACFFQLASLSAFAIDRFR